jgi:hypothetical protein
MKSTRWPTRIALATWLMAVTVAVLGTACSSPDSTKISQIALPDRTEYKTSVSPFMERRCGALDCHGQAGRPLRLYSQFGLRLKRGPNGARDTSPTTDDELTANYFATVGLEPEDISDSLLSEGAFNDFLLLKKPLDIENGGVRHKGGPVLRGGDQGFDCLYSWISGKVNAANCAEGAKL